ncbi:hypothetical protein GO730_39170 [Spirosoma sp. HMF3257]|uniref:Uncharacterized protein n=1 Tax=Spirosoma telluris TaxID=2183553 RepID=A0A327NFT4_9BACT|nr:hypothetical protein [Spirosoma telluris]RAI72914.1 hypothetical protein HMF3257_39100 [Spirosoma telluris]
MPNGLDILQIRQHFAAAVTEFADLHLSADEDVSNLNDPTYVGSLKGMAVVKEKIAKTVPINFYKPGDIITNLESKLGIRFYVLGPPTSIDAIHMESAPSNKPNEAYQHSHNNTRTNSEAFTAAILNPGASHILPFDEAFLDLESQLEYKAEPSQKAIYERENWRTINHDWLNSAGSLALRMNSSTNNLSLALAIEFVGSGRIMLFPGDAEYGSWASWHDIVWTTKGKDDKPLETSALLNQTVFYKVAHHLSHNGSAKLRGVEMMTHPDLAAMATLDYDRISPGWTSTMPNRDLVAALLTRTKGRFMIMNEKGLFVDQAAKKEPLSTKIKEVREQLMSSEEQKEFKKAFTVDPGNLYLEYRVEAQSKS